LFDHERRACLATILVMQQPGSGTNQIRWTDLLPYIAFYGASDRTPPGCHLPPGEGMSSYGTARNGAAASIDVREIEIWFMDQK
jgi:hypothetical protein